MNRKATLFALLAAAALAGPLPAQDLVPPYVNYQGVLTDSSGDVLTGTVDIEASVHDLAAGGTLLWGPQTFTDVPLYSGTFDIILSQDTDGDSVTDLETGAFTGPDAYMSIRVDGASELLPRQRFLAVPYAVRALDAASSGAGDLEARVAALESLLFGGQLVETVAYGGSGDEQLERLAIAPNGDLYAVGSYTGTGNFGGGDSTTADSDSDGFLVRYEDGTLNHLWTRIYGGTGEQSVRGLDVDSFGNTLICGAFEDSIDLSSSKGAPLTSAGNTDMFLASFDPDGNLNWAQQFGGPFEDGANDVTFDLNGDIFVTGYIEGDVMLGSTNHFTESDLDFALIKLQADGTYLWSIAWGTTSRDGNSNHGNDEYGSHIEVDSNNDVILTGGYTGPVRPGFNTPLFSDYNGRQTSAGGGGSGTKDRVWIGKYAGSNGAYQWFWPLATNRANTGDLKWDDTPRGIVITSEDDVVLAMEFYSRQDLRGAEIVEGDSGNFFQTGALARYSGTDGAHMWSYALNHPTTSGNNESTVDGIAISPAGDVYVAGSQYSTSAQSMSIDGLSVSDEFFAAKIDPENGNGVWVAEWSASDTEDVIPTAGVFTGNTYVFGGVFDITADFGEGNIVPDGQDIFITEVFP